MADSCIDPALSTMGAVPINVELSYFCDSNICSLFLTVIMYKSTDLILLAFHFSLVFLSVYLSAYLQSANNIATQ